MPDALILRRAVVSYSPRDTRHVFTMRQSTPRRRCRCHHYCRLIICAKNECSPRFYALRTAGSAAAGAEAARRARAHAARCWRRSRVCNDRPSFTESSQRLLSHVIFEMIFRDADAFFARRPPLSLILHCARAANTSSLSPAQSSRQTSVFTPAEEENRRWRLNNR